MREQCDSPTETLCCSAALKTGSGLSHLCAARSQNGINGWRIDAKPTLMANPEQYPEEIWGIEDPRITYVPELEQFAVAYTSFARGGPGVSLALTKDFRTFERFGGSCARGQRRRAAAAKNQWLLGHDPSPHDHHRRAYVDLVLPGSAPLGKP